MSLIGNNNKRGGGKAGARRSENQRIYANPLPLLLTTPEVSSYSPLRVLGLFGISSSKLENPHCEQVLELARGCDLTPEPEVAGPDPAQAPIAVEA